MRVLVEKQEPVKGINSTIFESTLDKEGEPQGCFIVNSGVELGLLDPEVSSFVEDSYSEVEKLLYNLILFGQQTGEIKAHLDPEVLSHYFMNAWLGIRTMVKTATNQQKLSGIITTTLSILD